MIEHIRVDTELPQVLHAPAYRIEIWDIKSDEYIETLYYSGFSFSSPFDDRSITYEVLHRDTPELTFISHGFKFTLVEDAPCVYGGILKVKNWTKDEENLYLNRYVGRDDNVYVTKHGTLLITTPDSDSKWDSKWGIVIGFSDDVERQLRYVFMTLKDYK